MNTYLVKTNSVQRNALDEQVTKFIYATNSSFRVVEHPEFKKMVTLMRPGYAPPNKIDVGGKLLDSIFKEAKEKCSNHLNGQTVCMSLDGWSNVHNEPVICVTVTTSRSSEIYLIDTSGHPHTAEYLIEIAKAAIARCEEEFKCHVRSIVTDNTGNVKKMCAEMENEEGADLITYGCSAHLLNLLAHDLHIPNVKEQIVDVVKYFRNNHFASAKYRQEGGLKLILPQDIRWNTMSDCLSEYIKNWPILMKVCEENRHRIDPLVYQKVLNMGLKRNAEDLLKRLKPISVALDKVQSDNCTISSAVHAWKELEEILKEEKLDKALMKKFTDRYSQSLGPAHFFANLIDPRYCGSGLSGSEKSAAHQFAKDKYGNTILPTVIKFQARASPFHENLFDQEIVSTVNPLDWWKIHSIDDAVMKAVQQLLTASASSASVERVFSSFGLVQSKLRNRLGIAKAAKLVFLFKLLNKPSC